MCTDGFAFTALCSAVNGAVIGDEDEDGTEAGFYSATRGDYARGVSAGGRDVGGGAGGHARR